MEDEDLAKQSFNDAIKKIMLSRTKLLDEMIQKIGLENIKCLTTNRHLDITDEVLISKSGVRLAMLRHYFKDFAYVFEVLDPYDDDVLND